MAQSLSSQNSFLNTQTEIQQLNQKLIDRITKNGHIDGLRVQYVANLQALQHIHNILDRRENLITTTEEREKRNLIGNIFKEGNQDYLKARDILDKIDHPEKSKPSNHELNSWAALSTIL